MLPPDSEIEARLLDTSAFPIVGVAVTLRQHRDLAQLSDFVIYEAAPQLRTIPGVYRVELNGAQDPRVRADRRPGGAGRAPPRPRRRRDRGAQRQRHRRRRPGARRLSARRWRWCAGRAPTPQTLLDVVVADDHGIAGDRSATSRASSRALREDFTRAAADGEPRVLDRRLAAARRQRRGDLRRRARAPRGARAARIPSPVLASSTIRPTWCTTRSPACATASPSACCWPSATIFFFIADLRATRRRGGRHPGDAC